jgi:hypothetical protein
MILYEVKHVEGSQWFDHADDAIGVAQKIAQDAKIAGWVTVQRQSVSQNISRELLLQLLNGQTEAWPESSSEIAVFYNACMTRPVLEAAISAKLGGDAGKDDLIPNGGARVAA